MRKFAKVSVLVLVAMMTMGQTAGRRRAIQPAAPPPPLPIAGNDAYSVQRGKSLTIAAPGVLANDSDPQSRSLTAALGSNVSHGTLTLNGGGGFTYANDGSAATSDSFTYTASNGTASSSAATVTITINDAPPVAVDDAFTLSSATAAVPIQAPGVLANDTLNGGAIVSYGATTGNEQTNFDGTATARGGAVQMNHDGSFAYQPPSGFTGSDTFVYVLRNGGGSSSATVTLNAPAQTTPDFTVNSPGFFFTFTGVNGENPVLTLKRGRTYRFLVDTDDIHPFEIIGAPAGSVQNNNISFGTVTFAVPAAAQNYNYKCSIHGFGNVINTTP